MFIHMTSESMNKSTKYLGPEIQKYHITGNMDQNNQKYWASSSDKYVKYAITDIELKLAQENHCFQMKEYTL